MENHPIPQDVTGFKFKLIGQITIKQFLYLLGAGFFVYFFFALPFPLFIKGPFILLAATLGVGLAFVPVEGRPMDKMLYFFIRALPAENQYVYHRLGATGFFDNLTHTKAITPKPAKNIDYEEAKKSLLARELTSAQKAKAQAASKEAVDVHFLNTIKTFFEESVYESEKPKGPPEVSTASTQASQSQGTNTPVELPSLIPTSLPTGGGVTPLDTPPPQEEETDEKKDIPAPIQPTIEDSEIKLQKLQEELAKALSEKEQLQKRFFEMAQQQPTEEVFTPKTEGEKKEKTTHVKTISKSNAIAAGFPMLPDIPNILLGIVKDPRGKVIQNILVEVIDKNNIPVRAFKTNALGQFISATPLPDGTYIIRFEDPTKNNEFDTVEVTLDGTIFQPLEITSIDQRERLRRELFGEAN